MPHIGCIVMASGASTRFGSNKLMAPFMGKPLIQHVIETAQTAGLEPIVVTIDDPFHEPILVLCNKLKVRAVTHSGTLQSDTVRRAMLEVQKDGLGKNSWDGAMFLQGDQPCVRADSLCALIASFEEHPEVLKNRVKGGDADQYQSVNEAIIDLKNDRIDALLIDRVYADYYLTTEGIADEYDTIPSGFESESFAVGVRPADKKLLEALNQAFKELYQEGIFQQISQKWFGEDVATPEVKGQE